MEMRPLGTSGIEVSAVCLGTMTFGQQNSVEEAHEQLDWATGHGVNFVDTAEMYPVPPRPETVHRTEEFVGAWLNGRGNRNQIVLATKVTGRSKLGWIRGGPRLTPAHIDQALAGSLKRLQTDFVDLYQIHWPERATNYFGRLGYTHREPAADEVPIAETLGALQRHVDAGRIRAIGISNETPWGLSEYLRNARTEGLSRVVSIQNPYSLLNRVFEVGLAESAIREEVGLLAYSPLGFGVLSGKYLNGARPKRARLTLFGRHFPRYVQPRAVAATQAYINIASKAGLDPAQMALAFVWSRPFVTAAIIGATSLTQLKHNLGAAALTLSPDVLAAIEAVHDANPNPAP